jgi:glutamine amidotransferase
MVVILDYGAGNLASVVRGLRRAGVEAVISSRRQDLASARGIILPGVGFFDAAMERLRSGGLIDLLEERVRGAGVPVLGICLGMQMLTEHSEEGDAAGLGWIAGRTRRFAFPEGAEAPKVPHLGWTEVQPRGGESLFDALPPSPCFYFAHSYYVECRDAGAVAAEAAYGVRFPAVLRKGNLYGTQFHPEKSHDNGARFLRNFVKAAGLA